MNRRETFLSFKTHALQGRMFKQLSPTEVEACLAFLDENSALTKDQFALKVNRWMIDLATKPKRHTAMWALVSQANY